MKTKTANLHILLALGDLSIKERVDLSKRITELGPTSPLYLQSPHIQAAVGQVSSFGAELGAVDDKLGSIEAQAAVQKELRVTAQNNLDKALGVLTSLVENAAKTADEAAGLGFSRTRIGRAASAPLAPPEGAVVKAGKKHHEVRVSVVSPLRHARFQAQLSPDPIGPATWQDLAGSGKTRVLTGHPAGALLWVRFRELRGRTASDWCAPVPVTIP